LLDRYYDLYVIIRTWNLRSNIDKTIPDYQQWYQTIHFTLDDVNSLCIDMLDTTIITLLLFSQRKKYDSIVTQKNWFLYLKKKYDWSHIQPYELKICRIRFSAFLCHLSSILGWNLH